MAFFLTEIVSPDNILTCPAGGRGVMALGLAIAKDLSDEAELNEICVDSITEKHFSPKQNFKRTKIPEVQEND